MTGDAHKSGKSRGSAPAIRGSVWMLAAAVLLVGLAALIGVRTIGGLLAAPPLDARDDFVRRAAAPPAVRPRPPRPPMPPQERPPSRQRDDAPRQPAADDVDYSSAAAYLEAAAAAAREAHARGEDLQGIWAFPPAGTKPALPGIVVPDDFELPPGYVRHYQSTDDGQALQPILMYHPDHAPSGEDGRPLQDPEDLVVPPEDAPAGIPVVILDVPEATFEGMQGGNPLHQ